MKNAIVIILFFCAKVTFSQQNIYDSLAHKFYDLNAKEKLSYQVVKSDLDSLIVSSKKNYYKHKVQEIDLISGFLEDLIALRDTNWLGNYQSIYNGFDSYTDSLLERQISESQKNRNLYDFEKIEYCLWNNRKNHPINSLFYKKLSNSICGPSTYLTCFITNEIRFTILNYEVLNNIDSTTYSGSGFTLSHSLLCFVLETDYKKLEDLILTSITIEDEIGNIFKIEKEFPLFKGYEFSY